VSHNRGIRVGCDSIIGDLSNISIIVVGVIVDSLGTAVRKGNRVGASLGANTIRRFSSIEVGVGVVISNSIVEVVGGDLSQTISNSMGYNRGMVSRGGMNHRGMVSRGGMNHRGSMDHSSWAVGRGSMNNRSSMDSM